MHGDPSPAPPRYDEIALVLQGGGALGAYQAGVFEALDQAGIAPSWLAGISIGAINAALIAGNAPERRVARLREFWERVSRPGFAAAFDPLAWVGSTLAGMPATRGLAASLAAGRALVAGQPGFFKPRVPPPLPGIDSPPGQISFYDTAELAATLAALVDFERLNSRATRVAFGSVDVESGNFAFFDSADMRLDLRHVLASSALPPAFAPVEIDGRWFWDGGLVSNTPLEYVLEWQPRRDTLAFQVDLWSARGPVPRRIEDALEREKDIRYSSRTRHGTTAPLERQRLRRAIAQALPLLPPELEGSPLWQTLEQHACTRVFNVVQLVYRDKAFETYHKDYEFSPETMREHWQAGLDDARASLARPDFTARPSADAGVATHDIHREPH